MTPSIMGKLPIRTSTVSAAARENRPRKRLYPRVSSAGPSSSRTTPYPAPSIARSKSPISAAPARYSTVALSAARLTFTSSTPGTLRNAFSMRPTQPAQLIPVTGTEIFPDSSPMQRTFASEPAKHSLLYPPTLYTDENCAPISAMRFIRQLGRMQGPRILV